LKKCGLESEHDVDLQDLQTLRKIPFIGKVCIDMIIQAREGVDVSTELDLLSTPDDELDNAIFGKPPEPDAEVMVDPDEYIQNVSSTPPPVIPKDNFHYDTNTQELFVRVPNLAARHADWLKRLSVYALHLNEGKNPHLFTPEMLVRKFILEARLQDKTDAGSRTGGTTMQQLPTLE